MEASGDSKLYNTIIGVTSLRPHQHHQSTFHSKNFKLAPSTFPIPLLLNFHHPPFLFLGPFATYFTSLAKDTFRFHSYHSRLCNFPSPTLPGQAKPSTTGNSKLPMTPMAQSEIPSYFPKIFHIQSTHKTTQLTTRILTEQPATKTQMVPKNLHKPGSPKTDLHSL